MRLVPDPAGCQALPVAVAGGWDQVRSCLAAGALGDPRAGVGPLVGGARFWGGWFLTQPAELKIWRHFYDMFLN